MATFTNLFSFATDPSGNTTGANPSAGLIADAQGNLYGTAASGGPNDTGTVYELVKGAGDTYTQTVLFSFAAYSNNGGNATGTYPRAPNPG